MYLTILEPKKRTENTRFIVKPNLVPQRIIMPVKGQPDTERVEQLEQRIIPEQVGV